MKRTFATFQFRASNEWLDGGHNRSTIQSFFGCRAEDATRNASFVLRMRVKSAAAAWTLRELAQFSPVYDIVSNSLPVEVTVETY